MSNKKELRVSIKKLRDAISPERLQAASRIVCQKVSILGLDEKSTNILLYFPFQNEIDPLSLMDTLEGKFFLPKIDYKSKTMDFYQYKKGDKLNENHLGIKEVENTSKILIPNEGDIIIVPSLGVDIEGNRLGYGGGFYDRYLSRYPDLVKIAINYEEVLQKKALPSEEHDIVMDYVITDKRIIIEDLRNF